MAVPQSEKEIAQMLNLAEYGKKFPIAYPSEEERVIVLDGVQYSEEAVRQALTVLDNAFLQDLIQYPNEIFNHNNIPGHGSAGGNLDAVRLFSKFSPEILERIKSLR